MKTAAKVKGFYNAATPTGIKYLSGLQKSERAGGGGFNGSYGGHAPHNARSGAACSP